MSLSAPVERQTSGDGIKKYQWIDALRGIAILLVIAVHVASTVSPRIDVFSMILHCGQFGVQLFFVLSAITLCMSYKSREGELNTRENFYIRRYFRIAPTYYLGIVVYFIWGIASNYIRTNELVPHWSYTPKNILANLTFIHGLVQSANNYVVPGGWSIGTEMLFYMIFPFLWKFQKNLSIKNLVFLLGVSVAVALLFVYCSGTYLHRSTINNSFTYFNIANQFPCFIIGIIAYRVISESLNVRFAGPGFLILFAIAAFLVHRDNWVSTALMPVTAAAAFFMLVFIVKNGKQGSIPQWLANYGKVSFSVYIFHFLVWHGLELILRRLSTPFVESGFGFVFMYLLVAGVTYGIAKLSYEFIEKRFIGMGEAVINRRLAPPQISTPV